jgi:hypothetical protein
MVIPSYEWKQKYFHIWAEKYVSLFGIILKPATLKISNRLPPI